MFHNIGYIYTKLWLKYLSKLHNSYLSPFDCQQILQIWNSYLWIRSCLSCAAYERYISTFSVILATFCQPYLASRLARWIFGTGQPNSCPSPACQHFVYFISFSFSFYCIDNNAAAHIPQEEGRVTGCSWVCEGGWLFVCRFAGILTSHSRIIIIIRVRFICPRHLSPESLWSSPFFT